MSSAANKRLYYLHTLFTKRKHHLYDFWSVHTISRGKKLMAISKLQHRCMTSAFSPQRPLRSHSWEFIDIFYVQNKMWKSLVVCWPQSLLKASNQTPIQRTHWLWDERTWGAKMQTNFPAALYGDLFLRIHGFWFYDVLLFINLIQKIFLAQGES